MPKRKKVASILLIPIIIFAVIILAMQIDTNSLMKELKDAFYCTDVYITEDVYHEDPQYYDDSNLNYITYKYDPAKPDIFARYNITGGGMILDNSTDVTTDLKLTRIFAWHNFNHGTIWFKYSVYVKDAEGKLIMGSKDIPVRMSIQKVDGAWEVTAIYERP